MNPFVFAAIEDTHETVVGREWNGHAGKNDRGVRRCLGYLPVVRYKLSEPVPVFCQSARECAYNICQSARLGPRSTLRCREYDIHAVILFLPTKPLVYKSAQPVHSIQMKQKPKLGQNFLVDDAARHAIVDALGDISKRTVIEIGPGHGAITEILAGRCRRLIALELDRALAAELTFRFRDKPEVQVLERDVLKTDLRALAVEEETVDVVGNLPYYITSDILLQLFAAGSVGVVE